MALTLDVQTLIDYTEWERRKWFEWLREHGDPVLQSRPGRMAMAVSRPSER